MPYYKRLSPTVETSIIQAYTSKHSAAEVANQHGITDVTVFNVLRRNGIAERHGSVRFPNLEHTYFDSIDSTEKAYLIGLVAADGCIEIGQKNRFKISLQESDRAVLDYYSRRLVKEDTIKVYPPSRKSRAKRNAAWLCIHSKQLVSRLVALGIGSNKTFSCDVDIDQFYDECLFRAFLLGLHDGDGSVYWTRRKGRRDALVFNLICSLPLAHRIEECVWKWTRIRFCKTFKQCQKGRLIYLRLNDQMTICRLLRWLYTDAPPVYLARKRQVYDDFLTYNPHLNHV